LHWALLQDLLYWQQALAHVRSTGLQHHGHNTEGVDNTTMGATAQQRTNPKAKTIGWQCCMPSVPQAAMPRDETRGNTWTSGHNACWQLRATYHQPLLLWQER
jgi:hypothetical protein